MSCKHLAVAQIAGKAVLCLPTVIETLCKSYAKMYWIGEGEPPEEEIEKFRKDFKKFGYCPKCGVKVYE